MIPDERCPYDGWMHTPGMYQCTCTVQDDAEDLMFLQEEEDGDVDELEDLEDVIEIEWLMEGPDVWTTTTDVDDREFCVMKDQESGKWFVLDHPKLGPSVDHDTFEDIQESLGVAEVERLEEIWEFHVTPTVLHTYAPIEDEEEDGMFGLERWRGGLDKEFDKANSSILNDTKKKDDDKWKGNVGSSSKGGTTTYVYQSCRHDPKLAFTIGDIKYHGGSESKVNWFDFDESWLIVCALGDRRLTYLSSNNEGLVTLLNPFTNTSPVLNIKWADMGAPPVRKGFWRSLHDWVVAQPEITNVLFYCMGGHGRTGTALAGTLIEVCGDTPVDAVAFVRKHYCDRTVESESQIRYLLSLKYEADEVNEMMKGGGVIKKSK